MIQFTLDTSSSTPTVQQLNDAIEKGIKWVQLPANYNYTEEELNEIENICRDNEIILTVTDDVNLLERRKFHGILFTPEKESVSLIRNELGAHPIIGIEIDCNKNNWQNHTSDDIDYITIDIDKYDFVKVKNVFTKIRANWDIRIVARVSNVTNDGIQNLLQQGFDGIDIKNHKNLMLMS